jgi:stearoyl-CoA desaturase (delta-9 desaturase)
MELHNDIIYPNAIPFVLVHIACLGILWTGVSWKAALGCAILVVLRIWAITAGFHRYFSHRSYKTSRWFQFCLAFLGETTAQRGVIWWAAIHRHHHRHSDTEEDIHSPRHTGFWFSHVGWIFHNVKGKADYSKVPDLTAYPELVWLNRWDYVPAFALALFTFLVGGWRGVFVGFFLSTVLVYHSTFVINSLAHQYGRCRYLTGDDSRNNWWLALITMGEGWHNNHHHYPSSTRQGFYWWEIDFSFYVLKGLSWLGVVWDLREPPASVRDELAPDRVVDRVARELAHTVSIEPIAIRVRQMWSRTHRPTKEDIIAFLSELHFPELPTLDELKRRGEEMFAGAPSLHDVAERARQIVFERIAVALLEEPLPAPAV